MPVNKNALLRYRILDQLISSRYLTNEELFEELNFQLDELGQPPVSIDTLNGDINDLKIIFEAPICYKRRSYGGSSTGYYYADPDFRLFNVYLNKEELEVLTFANNLLDLQNHIPVIREAQKILKKIYFTVSNEKMNDELIGESEIIQISGEEWIEQILDSILHKTPISIVYSETSERKNNKDIISPYKIFKKGIVWFLIGKSMISESLIRIPLRDLKVYEKKIGVSFQEPNPDEIAQILKKDLEQKMVTKHSKKVNSRPPLKSPQMVKLSEKNRPQENSNSNNRPEDMTLL